MKTVIGIVLIILFELIGPNNLNASSAKDLESFRQSTERDIKNFRKLIEERGTEEARRADRSVAFVIGDSLLPMIWVEPGTRKNIIKITPQLQLVISYLSEASLVGLRYSSYSRCDLEYQRYIFETYQKNAQRMMKGELIEDMDAPEIFAVKHGGVCRGFEKYLNPLVDELRPQRGRSVYNSTLFFYFHELGHIAKGHSQPNSVKFMTTTDEKKRYQAFLEYMRRSREQETEADRWAVDQLIKMGMSPIDLMVTPALELMIASSGIDCAFEPISTHPFGITRMDSILSQIELSHRAKYGKDVPQQMLELIRDTGEFYDKVKTQFECK